MNGKERNKLIVIVELAALISIIFERVDNSTWMW